MAMLVYRSVPIQFFGFCSFFTPAQVTSLMRLGMVLYLQDVGWVSMRSVAWDKFNIVKKMETRKKSTLKAVVSIG